MGIEVKHITSVTEAPLPLTDREGSYVDELVLVTHWGLMNRPDAIFFRNLLASQYPESQQHEMRPGNPARFMHSDITFLAEIEGDLCVHAEVELDFCESDNPADFDDSPSDVVTPEEFKRRVAVWKTRLEAIAPCFPHTTFFLSSEFTYDGRLTLNAITPLANGIVGERRIAAASEGFFLSPYVLSGQSELSIASCSTLETVCSCLEELAYQPGVEAAEILQRYGFTSGVSALEYVSASDEANDREPAEQ